MEPNTLIYALNVSIALYRKILQNYAHSIIKFQGCLLGNPIYVKIFLI